MSSSFATTYSPLYDPAYHGDSYIVPSNMNLYIYSSSTELTSKNLINQGTTNGTCMKINGDMSALAVTAVFNG